MQRIHCTELVEHRCHSLDPFAVGNQHLGVRVGEAVLHLVRSPPGIHADARCAEGNDRPVAEDPLGVVAHRHGHAIAAPDTVLFAQVVSQRLDDRIRLGVGEPLIFEHDVVAVGVAAREFPHKPHRRRRRLEDPHRDPPDLDLFHRELRTWCCQFFPRFFKLHEHALIIAATWTPPRIQCVRITGSLHPSGSGQASESYSQTTYAAATKSLWVRLRCHVITPASADNSAARPVNARLGTPDSARSTHTSWNPKAPSPRPNAFMTASRAANRAARDGTGSACGSTYANSLGVKSRVRIDGVRCSEMRNRSISTTSIPIPIIASGSPVVGGVGDRADEQVLHRELAKQRIIEAAFSFGDPVDEPVVTPVVALQHTAHVLGRE